MIKIKKNSYEILNGLSNEEMKYFIEILTKNQVYNLEIYYYDEAIKLLRDNKTIKTLKLFIQAFTTQLSHIIASIIQKNVINSLEIKIIEGQKYIKEIYTALKSNTSLTEVKFIGLSLNSKTYETFQEFLTNTPNLSTLSFSVHDLNSNFLEDKLFTSEILNKTFSTLKNPISLKHLEILHDVSNDELSCDFFKNLVNLESFEIFCRVDLKEFTKKITYKTHPKLKSISLIPKEIDSELDFQNSTFTHFTLLNCNGRKFIGLKILNYLMKGLLGYKNLKYLSIENEANDEKEKDWIYCLKDLLIKSDHLEVLNLINTCLNTSDLPIIYEGLKQNDSLKALKLPLYFDENLGKVLQPKNLDYLKLVSIFVKENNFNGFMSHFQFNKSLKKLKLRCEIDELGRKLFLNFLNENQSIENLNFLFYDINNDFLLKLSEILPKKNIKVLKLIMNFNDSFKGTGFEYLFKSLLSMKSLEVLYLELDVNLHLLTLEHFQILFENLAENKNIKDFTFYCNSGLEEDNLYNILITTLFYNYNLRKIEIDPLKNFGKEIQERNLEFISNYYHFKDRYQNLYFYFQ